MTPPTLPEGIDLVFVKETTSTSDVARHLAGDGAAHLTVVQAGRQTAGRGRRGRPWVSEDGNLYLSVVLRLGKPPAEATQVSFVAAVAVAEALDLLLPPGPMVTCKWPNDVLVGGRKICGLLLESSGTGAGPLDWLILGIGLNVVHCPDDPAYPATSVAREGGAGGLAAALPIVLRAFVNRLAAWQQGGFAPVRRAWRLRAHGLGTPIRVGLPDAELHGTFRDLDESGALVLDTADGPRHIMAGDVFFE